MKAAPFHTAIKDCRDDCVEAVLKRLKSSDAPHYRKAGRELLRARSEKLVDAFVRSMKGDAGAFATYIEKLAEERIAEGFFLREIQLALSILEEQAWRIAVERSSIGTLVSNLGLITNTIGQAKDRLARIYLEHKERAETTVTHLERRLDALFKGTESVDLEED